MQLTLSISHMVPMPQGIKRCKGTKKHIAFGFIPITVLCDLPHGHDGNHISTMPAMLWESKKRVVL